MHLPLPRRFEIHDPSRVLQTMLLRCMFSKQCLRRSAAAKHTSARSTTISCVATCNWTRESTLACALGDGQPGRLDCMPTPRPCTEGKATVSLSNAPGQKEGGVLGPAVYTNMYRCIQFINAVPAMRRTLRGCLLCVHRLSRLATMMLPDAPALQYGGDSVVTFVENPGRALS